MIATTKKFKVLHIITNLPIGGAQDNTLITVEGLNRDRYDVDLISASDGDWFQRANAIPNMRLLVVNELMRKINPVYDLIALIKIFRLMKKGNYDIVHTHSSKPGFLGRIASRLVGGAIVVHTIHGFPFHDFMHPIKRHFFILIERMVARLSDKLITVSKLNRQKAIQLRIAKHDKFVNIYSGIRFDKFENISVSRPAKCRELGIDPNSKIVGMVGRLSKQKSPHILINAIPSIIKKFPDTQFVIVGDGELRYDLEKLIKKLGLSERVHLLGYRSDIPELVSIMDIFVLSSSWEGLGRSLTEAMYLGRAVVATRVEGVPEIVHHNKTGLLVPPQDVPAISNAIIDLLSHPEKAARLGERANARVAKDFCAQRMVDDIECLYEKLIEEHAQNRRKNSVDSD
ncbi:glycosyltransferase family 4 protein [candidate division KSB1 bacterium]|nr:glycosyltransferase family 4 protein [candidate division KSB1 bacterium]